MNPIWLIVIILPPEKEDTTGLMEVWRRLWQSGDEYVEKTLVVESAYPKVSKWTSSLNVPHGRYPAYERAEYWLVPVKDHEKG